MKAGRGVLTPTIKTRAKKLLGREITQLELRLMPYIQFVMVNDQVIVPCKINAAEREILSTWRNEGHIEGGVSGLAITPQFWAIINELIWLGYVAYRADPAFVGSTNEDDE